MITELIESWNPVATFFTVWGLAALVACLIVATFATQRDRKERRRQDDGQLAEILDLFEHRKEK